VCELLKLAVNSQLIFGGALLTFVLIFDLNCRTIEYLNYK